MNFIDLIIINKVYKALQWRRLKLTRYLRKKMEKYRLLPPKPKLKQEALFWEALDEAGIKGEKRVDHINARCYVNNREYNVIFSFRYLKEIKNLNKDKKYNFCFVGKETENRQWVKKFNFQDSYIQFTDKGRKVNKSFLDTDYYQIMSSSNFTLCPKGDFKWTYRFYEAIMCMSIPVVDPSGIEPTMDGFTYYRHTDEDIVFSQEICRKNYLLFLERHTLLSTIINFSDLPTK